MNEEAKANELTENELESVVGGDEADMSYKGIPVCLTGPYYADSYAGDGPYTYAIGWGGLTLGRVFHGRSAPYEIKNGGTTIGWAPQSSITY